MSTATTKSTKTSNSTKATNSKSSNTSNTSANKPSNKPVSFDNINPKKLLFSYSPSDSDVDAYLRFLSGNAKSKPYMKDYKALHHISGLSDNSILVYEAIRNLMGLFFVQLKNCNTQNKKPLKSNAIGVTRNSGYDSIVGMTMVITNPMLQEWIGNKSHNTIKAALEQLESMGFIKCSTDSTKKSGRKITLLRDMEEYQPEEIYAIENYIRSMNSCDNGCENKYDNGCDDSHDCYGHCESCDRIDCSLNGQNTNDNKTDTNKTGKISKNSKSDKSDKSDKISKNDDNACDELNDELDDDFEF